MIPPRFNNPPLDVGDHIELFEINLAPHDPMYVDVARIGSDGKIYVTLHGDINGPQYWLSPNSTHWCHTTPRPHLGSLGVPTVKYGATCTGKYCGEFFPHAEDKPGFLCYSCRHR